MQNEFYYRGIGGAGGGGKNTFCEAKKSEEQQVEIRENVNT